MGMVMIRCPSTGGAVSTQIETEPSVFNRLPQVAALLHCPICGKDHIWTTREAWLEDASYRGGWFEQPSLVPIQPEEEEA